MGRLSVFGRECQLSWQFVGRARYRGNLHLPGIARGRRTTKPVAIPLHRGARRRQDANLMPLPEDRTAELAALDWRPDGEELSRGHRAEREEALLRWVQAARANIEAGRFTGMTVKARTDDALEAAWSSERIVDGSDCPFLSCGARSRTYPADNCAARYRLS